MRSLANFLGYQIVWFIAVIGAGRGLVWPAVAGLAIFAACQLALSHAPRADLKLLALAVMLGAVLDGALSLGGLLHYAAPTPAVPPGGAPLWILALWGAFALTLNHSLAWLRRRRLTATVLGVAGGPLAYLAAARLSQAVTFSSPPAEAIVALAVGWGVALFVLVSVSA
ncbi:MAG TPA: DUF2878 domain-containing protein [Steroidobacteraceae bacterium]|nr:DUF2878 domain-containing protein [Steroidobacteraceae bacterium]